MNRAAAITMALMTLVPASAIAQQRTVTPPGKWEDVPEAQLRVGAPATAAPGVTWRAPAAGAAMPPMSSRPAPPPLAGSRAPHPHGHPPAVTHADAPRHHGMTHGRDRMKAHSGKRMIEHHSRRGINGYPHYRRVDRGFALPQRWWGPSYQVRNWGAYGLPQPMHGGRWVRYYDDALLVDPYGRVHDGRWGMSWDEYGDDWGYDESGIPAYVGDGDYHPADRDYAWVEDHEGGYRDHGYAGGQHPGYAYPSYGHSYGYGYGAVITETTVTTSPTIIEKTYYVDEEVHAAPRRHRSKTLRAK